MPLFLILRRSVVRPFLDCRNRRNPHRTASARSVAAPVGLLDRNCTINDKFLRQRAGRTFFSCYPEPARARPQVAAVNFASLVVLLAARPFVQPTLPVRAVQAGLSAAERRGGRRSQPRWLSLAASVRRGWVAVPASSWRLGHTNKFDGARLLRRFGLAATRQTINRTIFIGVVRKNRRLSCPGKFPRGYANTCKKTDKGCF
ncbi:Uncharacterised protein [Rikenella microfusus]|uniref:Uncharacterized protein n=1 Tax=Rikenella microfusus TaxID=28139 RepID=A0A379MS64_9BACT|nr:Uncharacterised protein [Rikenella microfusus]